MTSEASTDPGAWGALADASEETRRAEMRKRYEELTQLSEAERSSMMAKLVESEYALSDDKLRIFTASRLMVWIDMDVQSAKSMAETYDHVMRETSANAAMRRVGMVQTLARGFTSEQIDRLYELIPSMIQHMPRGEVLVLGRGEEEAASPVERRRKPWWQFWKRG